MCAALDGGDVEGATQVQVALTTSDWDEGNGWHHGARAASQDETDARVDFFILTSERETKKETGPLFFVRAFWMERERETILLDGADWIRFGALII